VLFYLGHYDMTAETKGSPRRASTPARIHNSEIAALFDRLADLLEIEGENPFRVRAYRNAARFIADYPKPMVELIREGQDLSKLPGVGKAIAEKIHTIVDTGELPQLEAAKSRVPEALSLLMHVRGLGPKRVKTLYQTLEVRSPEDLKRAVRTGKVRNLEGFGEKTEHLIEEGLRHLSASERRTRLLAAEQVAETLLAYLRDVEGVRRATLAGSYRRRRDSVGDLDILVTCAKGAPVMARFARYEEVDEVVSQGETRSTVLLRSGLQVDLRVVPEASYGAALQYFTGSKAHNVAIRKIAAKKGLKLNEYGVFKGEKRVAGKSEKEVYASVGLPYIEPELRENRGEIETAARGDLPRLVELAQIRGDLHCHTKASDGHDTLETLAKAAAAHRYEYLAITDHTKRVSVAHGLDARRLRRQMNAIDRLNEKLDGLVLLKSAEVDILEDGSLDLPDDVLHDLDITIGAVHYGFGLSRSKQTERVLRAMDHPCFHILAHPTGRLLGEREGYDINLERVIEAAGERGCFLELNAQPSRLDLSDNNCKLAKEMGVKVAVSTDAHRGTDLEFMRLGIYQARRGWLERHDVLNTRSLAQLRRLLRR